MSNRKIEPSALSHYVKEALCQIMLWGTSIICESVNCRFSSSTCYPPLSSSSFLDAPFQDALLPPSLMPTWGHPAGVHGLQDWEILQPLREGFPCHEGTPLFGWQSPSRDTLKLSSWCATCLSSGGVHASLGMPSLGYSYGPWKIRGEDTETQEKQKGSLQIQG